MSNNEYGSGFGSQFSGQVSYNSANNPDSPPETLAPGTEAGLLNLGSAEQALLVRDISTEEFMTEVLEASRKQPVLVDFWAPWCGPCKQLTPVLEAAVAKAAGKVKLVKMNIDDYPEVAGQMGIQSIPAVVAFVNAQPKDAFMGAKSASEIDAFIARLAGPSKPSPLDEALEKAASLAENGNDEEASNIYVSILQQLPDNLDAIAAYGQLLLRNDAVEEAKSLLANAPPTDTSQGAKPHPGIAALTTAIELRDQAGDVSGLGELEALLAANPKNHQARFDLALALNARGKREAAADQLLEIMRKERTWNEDAAKTQLLKFFEAWGHTDPATVSARRQLSSMLFS
jgi:putative thioredoxin